MANIGINLNSADHVTAGVLGEGSEYGPFIMVQLDESTSLYISGFGRDASKNARALAAELTKAADAIDAMQLPAPAQEPAPAHEDNSAICAGELL